MKQFMVTCAVLPLLLVIIIQVGLDQINAYKLSAINQYVYAEAQDAKHSGQFNYDSLENNLVNKLKFDEEDISFNYESPNRIYHRGELIPYYVKVRINKPMVGFFIKSDKNQYYYVIDSQVASEKI